MTASDSKAARKLHRSAEIITGTLIWALVVASAAMQTAVLLSKIPQVASGWTDRVMLSTSWIGIEACWIGLLLAEQLLQHDRVQRRLLRRQEWAIQALIVGLLIWISLEEHIPAQAAVFAVASLVVAISWHEWLKSRALHPDDQKAVDQALAERAKVLKQQYDEQARDMREEQLRKALTQLRLPAASTAQDDQPGTAWNVKPGRHAPVVYFIRNGNRIKIGTTTDLNQRVRRLALRHQNVALIIAGSRDTERAMHRRFTSLRIGTTEWFRDAEPLTEFIAHHAEQALKSAKEEKS